MASLTIGEQDPKLVLAHLQTMQARALASSSWKFAGIFERVDSLDSKVPEDHWVYRCARDPEEEKFAVVPTILRQLSQDGVIHFIGHGFVSNRFELASQ